MIYVTMPLLHLYNFDLFLSISDFFLIIYLFTYYVPETVQISLADRDPIKNFSSEIPLDTDLHIQPFPFFIYHSCFH